MITEFTRRPVAKGTWYMYIPSSRYAHPRLIRMLTIPEGDRYSSTASCLVYEGNGQFSFTTIYRRPYMEMDPRVFFPNTSLEELEEQAREFLRTKGREDQL